LRSKNRHSLPPRRLSHREGSPTPISPPPVKGADLLPPVVLGNPSAAAERDPVAFFLLSGLRFQHWCRSLTRHPTPIEALAPRGGVRARRRSRPRNSVVPSYRPPHDGRRHRGASVVSRLGGGAASIRHATSSWPGEGGRPIKRTRCRTYGS